MACFRLYKEMSEERDRSDSRMPLDVPHYHTVFCRTLHALPTILLETEKMETSTTRGRTISENSEGKRIDGRRRSSLADQAIELAHELKDKVVGPSKNRKKSLMKQESQEKFNGLVELMYEANAQDADKKVYPVVKEEDMLAVAAEEFEKFKSQQGVAAPTGTSPPKVHYHHISEIYSH
uniref:Uncharacterized protein n=2 Tax=Plectus sambesii TaxID=2011161 RepID=A0A914W125_9BILA